MTQLTALGDSPSPRNDRRTPGRYRCKMRHLGTNASQGSSTREKGFIYTANAIKADRRRAGTTAEVNPVGVRALQRNKCLNMADTTDEVR